MNNVNFTYTNLTPFKWYVLENFPFIEADFDALTNWQLFRKLGKEINKIIPAVNKVGQQTEDLTEFVTNYFKNLDVQEEINNKLDQMVQDGTLEEIITSYLEISGLICFNTVEEMKAATNLINGSFAKTLGFYSINDGGGAIYKIKQIDNTDSVDNMFTIPLNNINLVADIIIDNNFNLLQIGAKKDNNSFDTTLIINAIIEKNINKIFFPNGKYYFLTPLSIDKSDLIISGDNANLYYLGNGDFIVHTGNSNDIRRININSLNFYGNDKSNNCFNLQHLIDSSISNCLINNFNTALTCSWSWDNIFQNVRFQDTVRPLQLGPQFNNVQFSSCYFATFTNYMNLTNCENISFINCDLTNNNTTYMIGFYQSSISFIDCYYENLISGRTIVGGYNETIKSVLNIFGGKISDTEIVGIDGYNAYLSIFNVQGNKIIPVSHLEKDKQSVGDNLFGLDLSSGSKPNYFNSLIYFDGTQNPNITPYQTSSMQKKVENGILKITIPDNSSSKLAGISINITKGKNYLLELEGKFEDETENIIFHQFNGGAYSVNRSFASNKNKIIVPFYAYDSVLYLRWSTTSTLNISKFKVYQLD